MLLSWKYRFGFLILFWLLLTNAAQAALELRVALKKEVHQVKVGSSTPAIILDGAGNKLGEISAREPLIAISRGNNISLAQWQAGEIIIEPSDNGYVWIGDSWYRGQTRLLLQDKNITAVNIVNLEDYLYSVVGAEAIPSWPIEALKAQAVAARSYALYKINNAGNRFYDLDATTNSQVYKGLNSEYSSTIESVNMTEGQILTYQGKPILALFHSSSGGHTENVEDVWNSNSYLPYLRGVVDYDQKAPVFQWTKEFSFNQLSSFFGGIGQVRNIIPERTTPYGRIVSLKIVGDYGTKVLSGQRVREVLGLKSTLFTISERQNSWEIIGHGSGHGIGLSQWGTYFLALEGTNYQQILSHYYQNVDFTSLN